jgi:gamma-glutamylputrescine oxidase
VDTLTINDRLGEYPNTYFAATATHPEPHPQAKGNISADVCVVGGGYSGLSTSLHLARLGFVVVLLEASRIGSGASGRNGGQVSVGQRVEQFELEKHFGKEHARTLWDIGVESVDLVSDLCAEATKTLCKVHPGIIGANHRQRYTKDSRAYVDHLQEVYDYDKISFLDQEQIREEVGSLDYCSGHLDMGSGHVNPLQYIFVLAELAEAAGVRIFETSRMTSFKEGDQVEIKTDKATVNAKYAVFGLNGYHNNIHRELERRVMPINNYVCVTEPLEESFARTVMKNNYAVADSRFVINYFHMSEDKRMIFGGGETYSYRFPKDIKAKVQKPMLEVFPQLKDAKIDYAWGGTLGITLSRLPHFDRLSGNILSVSGFSGHGVAMATLAGKMAAEAIDGQAKRFDIMRQLPTARFPGGAMLRYPALVASMLWYSMLDKI